MLLTQEDAQARLSSESNLLNRLGRPTESVPQHVPIQRPGNNRPHLHTMQRTAIAIMARGTDEKQSDIAKTFGIHQTEVSKIKNGGVAAVDEEAVERTLGQVRDVAIERLMSTMGLITDEKLERCKATELSSIASNMSNVMARTLPKDSGGKGTNVQLVIFSPEARKETSYVSVEV